MSRANLLALPWFLRIGFGLVRAAQRWVRRRIEHRAVLSLHKLDDHMLRDIGLVRGDLPEDRV